LVVPITGKRKNRPDDDDAGDDDNDDNDEDDGEGDDYDGMEDEDRDNDVQITGYHKRKQLAAAEKVVKSGKGGRSDWDPTMCKNKLGWDHRHLSRNYNRWRQMCLAHA
jgi:hypothetical protein